jgi:hypothetical protein
MTRRLLILTALTGALATGCDIAALERRGDYLNRMESRLGELSLQADDLARLQAEVVGWGITSDPQLALALVELDQKQQLALERLEEAEDAAPANWEACRSALDEAVEDLERSCESTAFLLRETLHRTHEPGASPDYMLTSAPAPTASIPNHRPGRPKHPNATA